ncbi:MAG TPA: hypothetical protein PL155_09265 [Candidatus Omnitrophota bacterium]|nr:hypothetical protein [Candidatus Omnitrophota bacterium]HPD85636.1 hypothetical protein [Candidatus Omnitrophota bacterium]HRZ04479.1 hypothetical protein [Candidatus Omnitrophota bacterium]
MEENNCDKNFGSEHMPRPENLIFSRDSIVAVYTVLCVLMEMRLRLGLEAMLEYLEKYVSIIGAHNPQMKNAVTTALKNINVDKIYREIEEHG